ncbi:MAG: LCP family protein [Candidatus Saccharimonas sp.]
MTRRTSIDGFVPRRSVGGTLDKSKPTNGGLTRSKDVRYNPLRMSPKTPTGLNRLDKSPELRTLSLRRSDVDESLREIDEEPLKQPKSRRRKSSKSLGRRIAKWAIIILIIFVVAVAGWVAYKAIVAGDAVFKGNIFGLVSQQKLKQDSNGRTNILVLGTSEDDPGHEGAYLTDSIMVMSLDQTKNDAYLISVPRDLPVQYGMACNSGYSGKINEYFNCVNGDYTSEAAEDERQTQTRDFIGKILGMDLQYSVHVNYTVMRDIVSAVGPITVNIQGSGGAPGVMDSNFDWKCYGGNRYASLSTRKANCPPNGHFIDYPNGPAVLDAEHALYLAQARGDVMPTYGLGHSNFDREQNQQKIAIAIRNKAMSSGTLTNVGKVSSLLDAIGKNLRTNFDTSEIRTLMRLAKDIPDSSIYRLNFLDDGIINGDATPTAGMFNYTQIRAYLQHKLSEDPVVREEAHVIVLNASGVSGLAQDQANKLADMGMIVDEVGNAPDSSKEGVNTIYQIADQPLAATVDRLKQVYGVTTIQTTVPASISVLGTTDYVIVVGKPTTDSSSN